MLATIAEEGRATGIEGRNAIKEYMKSFKEKKINNVAFSGRYLKENEDDIVSTSDFVNILLPQTRVQQAMANRFYLAILNYKPVIVNAESIQVEYVKKYGLGIIWEQGTILRECIHEYILNFNRVSFCKGRHLFFHELLLDIEKFETPFSGVLINQRPVGRIRLISF